MNSELLDYYVNLLILQYKAKEKAPEHIRELLRIVMIYDLAIQVRDGYNIETAIGYQLDILGKYFNVDRGIFDGILWTEQQTLLGDVWSLTYGIQTTYFPNGVFFAGAGANSVYSSIAGALWESVGNLDGQVKALASGNDFFIAGTSSGTIWKSWDGTFWIQQNLGSGIVALTHGNGVFVAATEDKKIWTSENGATWTERQTLDYDINDLTFGNDVFVSSTKQISGGNNGSIWTSVDLGVTWVNQQTELWGFGPLIFGNDIFLAGSGVGANHLYLSSDNGETWELQESIGHIDAFVFGNGTFIASNQFYTKRSYDGINWENYGAYTWHPLDDHCYSMTYGKNLFVAGTGDTGDSIWTIPEEEETFRIILKLLIFINNSKASNKNIDDFIFSFFGTDDFIFNDRLNMSIMFIFQENMRQLFTIAKNANLIPKPMGVGLSIAFVPDITKIFCYVPYGQSTPDFGVGFAKYGDLAEGSFLKYGIV
jgi:hypothetical protein